MGELQDDINRLKREGVLSNNAIYQGYLQDMGFKMPEKFPTAKSLIILAVSDKLMHVNFQLNGRRHDIMLPPQYYATGLTDEAFHKYILTEIVRAPGCKLKKATGVHLKLLAVRSGLGRYGRNNLCYVDGLGSLLKLTAFFTDYSFDEDHWTALSMMDQCASCTICINCCPTQCISKEKFVIDVGRCITLYNECKGKFPKWIPPDAHNSLVGCMRCQLTCPANREAIKSTGQLEDVIEEETRKILNGTPDKELLTSLSRKLRNFVPAQSEDSFPIFTRNLRALLAYP